VDIPIDENNILWENENKVNKFKRQYKSEFTAWLDVENSHFKTWMDFPFSNNFYKIWGVINKDLLAGTYTVLINNTYII
jgi:hypothetical protein